MRNIFLTTIVLALSLTGWAFSGAAQTQVYKTVNKDGPVTYSDTPTAGAEELELSGSSTIESVPVKPLPPLSSGQDNDGVNYRLNIMTPAPDATLRNNNGDIRIATRIEPQAQGNYLLDFGGQQYSSTSGVFNLENIDRGTHTYTVLFTDNKGKVIASSEQRTLHLHQASVMIRQSIN